MRKVTVAVRCCGEALWSRGMMPQNFCCAFHVRDCSPQFLRNGKSCCRRVTFRRAFLGQHGSFLTMVCILLYWLDWPRHRDQTRDPLADQISSTNNASKKDPVVMFYVQTCQPKYTSGLNSAPTPSLESSWHWAYVTSQTAPPMTIAAESNVKIAAPALSAVVIFLRDSVGSDGAVDPAFGSLCEVAPVLDDFGTKTSLFRVEPITDRAAI